MQRVVPAFTFSIFRDKTTSLGWTVKLSFEIAAFSNPITEGNSKNLKFSSCFDGGVKFIHIGPEINYIIVSQIERETTLLRVQTHFLQFL